MTQSEIAELERLYAAAKYPEIINFQHKENAHFVRAAYEHVPSLLAAAKRAIELERELIEANAELNTLRSAN